MKTKPEYFDNHWWLTCCKCGEWCIVGDEVVTKITCSRCTYIKCYNLLSDEEKKKLLGKVSSKNKKPRGWHLYKIFVASNGTVYHHGKEQPELKDTLLPTKIKRKKKIKKPKVKYETELFKLAKEHKEKQKVRKKKL
tara:strand:+ start:508 stop:918 length:411 start_codon:yes stop_codon:yes gene_type:complete